MAVKHPTVADGTFSADGATNWDAAHTVEDGTITEAMLSIADNTTKDVSTTAHGFAPKAPNDATKYLDGTGAYSVPAGGTAATQAEQETGSATNVFTTPGRQQFHTSAAKVWVIFNGTGTPTAGGSYNLSSITDNGVGDYTINFTTAFSGTGYACLFGGESAISSSDVAVMTLGVKTGTTLGTAAASKLVGSVRILNRYVTPAGQGEFDPVTACMACYGDQ